ncbi:hypothetical protein GF389_01605 [Candidatus Dojkabacteria bacterium]|nr:hypothetical protein [Candidatus Dojkabacteria bacterium]
MSEQPIRLLKYKLRIFEYFHPVSCSKIVQPSEPTGRKISNSPNINAVGYLQVFKSSRFRGIDTGLELSSTFSHTVDKIPYITPHKMTTSPDSTPGIFDTMAYGVNEAIPVIDTTEATQLVLTDALPAHQATLEALPLTVPEGSTDSFMFTYGRVTGTIEMIRALGGVDLADRLIYKSAEMLEQAGKGTLTEIDITMEDTFIPDGDEGKQSRGRSKGKISPGFQIAITAGEFLHEAFMYEIDPETIVVTDADNTIVALNPQVETQQALYNWGRLEGALTVLGMLDNMKAMTDGIKFNLGMKG